MLLSLLDVGVEFKAGDGLKIAITRVEEANSAEMVFLADVSGVCIQEGTKVDWVALELDLVVNQGLKVEDLEVGLVIHNEEACAAVWRVRKLAGLGGEGQGRTEEAHQVNKGECRPVVVG